MPKNPEEPRKNKKFAHKKQGKYLQQKPLTDNLLYGIINHQQ